MERTSQRLMAVGVRQLGSNRLDRLKVRASARFLGLIPLGRDEDDIEWVFGAWHAGPIRVVRRESQWVRLGWACAPRSFAPRVSSTAISSSSRVCGLESGTQ